MSVLRCLVIESPSSCTTNGEHAPGQKIFFFGALENIRSGKPKCLRKRICMFYDAVMGNNIVYCFSSFRIVLYLFRFSSYSKEKKRTCYNSSLGCLYVCLVLFLNKRISYLAFFFRFIFYDLLFSHSKMNG